MVRRGIPNNCCFDTLIIAAQGRLDFCSAHSVATHIDYVLQINKVDARLNISLHAITCESVWCQNIKLDDMYHSMRMLPSGHRQSLMRQT